MSGFLGNPDAEAEHALILSENGIDACRQALSGSIRDRCLECGEKIEASRVQACKDHGIACLYCVNCQKEREKKPRARIRMLDRIL